MKITEHEVSDREPGALAYVVANLRERDKREIYALRFDDDPMALLRELMLMVNAAWRIWAADGEPVAVMGATPSRPGVAMLACFGTDQWDLAVPAMLRYGRYALPVRLDAHGVHRAEAHALADNHDAARFIALSGGVQEAVLHEYGRGREDFLLYRWRVRDVLQQWRLIRRDTVPILFHEGRAVGNGRAGPAPSCH